MSLAENIAKVNANIAAAAREAGRDPSEIALVAATKVQTSDTIRQAIAAGVTICGENRVQEMTAHLADNAYDGAALHFIGHLQTNKIKKVLGRAALIQSVDSHRLLAALEKEAAKLGLTQDILLEVNIGEEASKTGAAPDELWALLDDAAQQPHLRVKGLMAIPPVNEDDDANRALLRQVYGLFVRAGERGYDNVSMEVLSMGMSGDFENAIREGATLVRLGTAIYGARDYGPKAWNQPETYNIL